MCALHGRGDPLEGYLVDRTYYTVTVMSPRDKPLPPDTARFLESFRLGSGKAKTDIAAKTPEQALWTFLVAIATKDEETLRAVTVSTDDFDWLMKGEGVPADKRNEFKAVVARQPIRALKAGDEVSLPGNRKTTVAADEVSDDRAVLLPEGAPLPNRLRKVDGLWRVDATPIVAGRKAAEAARKKAREAQSVSAPSPDFGEIKHEDPFTYWQTLAELGWRGRETRAELETVRGDASELRTVI